MAASMLRVYTENVLVSKDVTCVHWECMVSKDGKYTHGKYIDRNYTENIALCYVTMTPIFY